ncbi:hypothetical protein OC834_007116 [Tilletia horrida]|nr:hypothetical protein OC834_007116 [Tilletia horrida]KAK0551141.1 hypothetical protein OC844_006621 [Tilletia horrida]
MPDRAQAPGSDPVPSSTAKATPSDSSRQNAPIRHAFTSSRLAYLQASFSVVALLGPHSPAGKRDAEVPSALAVWEAVQRAAVPLHGATGGSVPFDVVDVRLVEEGGPVVMRVQVLFRIAREHVDILSTTLLAADSNLWAQSLFPSLASSSSSAGSPILVRCTVQGASAHLERYLSDSNAWMASLLASTSTPAPVALPNR